MKTTEAAYLKVGNTLYKGRNGMMDFSNHKEDLKLLPEDTVIQIVFFEIIENDLPAPPPLTQFPVEGGGYVG